MSDQNLYEKIEAYLNGELEGSILSEFELQLKNDKELAAQVELFKDVDDAIKDKSTLDFQKLVADQGNAFLSDSKPTQPVVKKINSFRYLIAAACTLLVMAAIFLLLKPSTSSSQELYAQHYEIFVLDENVRSTISNDSDFDLAVENYQNERYDKAIELFKNILDDDPSDMITTFYLAHSYINNSTDDFDMARVNFEMVVQEGNSIYVPDSKWYLALIHLAQDNPSQAKTLLEELKTYGPPWDTKANQLITQLGN